jgi:Flp pilus assembly protein TadG
MAMILPVIVLLLFGVIEMSWLFAQANDVRHGAREGARLAAVNWGDSTAIGTEVCNRMDLADGNLVVTFADASAGIDDGARASIGRIQVTLTPSSLTGMFDGLIGGNTIVSDIAFVLEQPITPEAQWWNDGAGGSHTCA